MLGEEVLGKASSRQRNPALGEGHVGEAFAGTQFPGHVAPPVRSFFAERRHAQTRRSTDTHLTVDGPDDLFFAGCPLNSLGEDVAVYTRKKALGEAASPR